MQEKLNEPKNKPENPQVILNGLGKAASEALNALAETIPQIADILEEMLIVQKQRLYLERFKLKDQLTPIETAELDTLEKELDEED